MKSEPLTGHYGVASAIRQVSGLRLTERTYATHLKTPRHSHTEGSFCLILEGASTQTYGSKSRTREPLATFFYPPGELQSESWHVGGRLFDVQIDSRWLGLFRQHSVIGQESTEARRGPVSWLVSKLYDEFRRMDETSPLVIEGLTLEIIGEASRQFAKSSNNGARWLLVAKEILHERFADSLTLLAIARIVHVHPVYLASAFRKKYHCTIGDYRRRLRIEFACRELSKRKSSLAQIAHAAGFSNQAHFTKTFKRLTGTTPGRYRADVLRS